MFKEIFIKLCSEKGVSPSAVCREVGITPATYSGWDENSVPRKTTLLRISEYFGVPVGYLLGEPVKEKAPPPIADDEAERLNRVLIYLEQNGFVAPGGTLEGRDRADYEKVSEAERVLLDLFRQFPEGSQQLYIEALRAALKK